MNGHDDPGLMMMIGVGTAIHGTPVQVGGHVVDHDEPGLALVGMVSMPWW